MIDLFFEFLMFGGFIDYDEEMNQKECLHMWEPTDTSGHYMECIKCGKTWSIFENGEIYEDINYWG